jgi:hypothetical protein
MTNYDLAGPNITVCYDRGELRVTGLYDSDFMPQINYGPEAPYSPITTEIGTLITAELYADRRGQMIMFGVLVPKVNFPPHSTEADVTGVAIFSEWDDSGALPSYTVRPMSGKAVQADPASASSTQAAT